MALTRRRLPNGQETTQVDPGETALLYREIFVEESYRRPGFPAADPKVIFDIGANIGLASMYFRQLFPDAYILAIEPGPDTFFALYENFQLHVGRGLVRNVAAAAKTGTMRFGYYPHSPAESGFYVDRASETELAKQLLMRSGFSETDADEFSTKRHELSFIECQTVTISDLIRDTGVECVDLLKIDVEKAEWDALLGIAEDDWPRIGQIVIEVHDIDGRLAAVTSLLRRHGFDLDTTQEERLVGTDMFMIFATRTPEQRKS